MSNIDVAIQHIQKTGKLYKGFVELEDELKKLQNLDQREKQLKSDVAKAQKGKQDADAELEEQEKKLVSEKVRLKSYVERKTAEAEKIVSDAKDAEHERNRVFATKVEELKKKESALVLKVDGINEKFVIGTKQLEELEGKIARARGTLSKIVDAVG